MPRRFAASLAISADEEYLLKRCRKKRKLFAFLRENRSKLFSEDFQRELEAMYRVTGAGKEAVCPSVLATALVLQGYLGIRKNLYDVRRAATIQNLEAAQRKAA